MAAAGCGDDRSEAEKRIDRVEQRYEELWNAESVSCREAPGKEGYECRIVSDQQQPGGATTPGRDSTTPPADSDP
ncbi:MAG: hypothetical protein ACRDLQ_02020 [Solirubrobacterales bacterium]